LRQAHRDKDGAAIAAAYAPDAVVGVTCRRRWRIAGH